MLEDEGVAYGDLARCPQVDRRSEGDGTVRVVAGNDVVRVAVEVVDVERDTVIEEPEARADRSSEPRQGIPRGAESRREAESVRDLLRLGADAGIDRENG